MSFLLLLFLNPAELRRHEDGGAFRTGQERVMMEERRKNMNVFFPSFPFFSLESVLSFLQFKRRTGELDPTQLISSSRRPRFTNVTSVCVCVRVCVRLCLYCQMCASLSPRSSETPSPSVLVQRRNPSPNATLKKLSSTSFLFLLLLLCLLLFIFSPRLSCF